MSSIASRAISSAINGIQQYFDSNPDIFNANTTSYTRKSININPYNSTYMDTYNDTNMDICNNNRGSRFSRLAREEMFRRRLNGNN